MLNDSNTSQNQDSENNSIPVSPQEPTELAPENTAHSEPSVALPEVTESSPSDFSVKSNDIPPSDSTPTEAEKEPITEEKQAQNEPSPEPVSEPIEAPESGTAQFSPFEPFLPLVGAWRNCWHHHIIGA